METKKNKKVIVAAVAFLVVFAAAALILYGVFKPKPAEGSKEITITVVNDKGEEKKYEHSTDAKFLRQAIEEIKDLSVKGPEEQHGMYVKEVNGVFASFEDNNAWWMFYVNGEYCNYSIDKQPIYDGDAFTIKYETGM